MKGSGDCEVSSEREAVQCFHGCSCGLLGASEELSPLLAGRSATHTRESLRETWAVVTPAHLAWRGGTNRPVSSLASGPAAPPAPAPNSPRSPGPDGNVHSQGQGPRAPGVLAKGMAAPRSATRLTTLSAPPPAPPRHRARLQRLPHPQHHPAPARRALHRCREVLQPQEQHRPQCWHPLRGCR